MLLSTILIMCHGIIFGLIWSVTFFLPLTKMLKCQSHLFRCFFCFLTVCQIMSKGVVAVLGPSASPASNSIISNICGEKEVRTGLFSSIVIVP